MRTLILTSLFVLITQGYSALSNVRANIASRPATAAPVPFEESKADEVSGVILCLLWRSNFPGTLRLRVLDYRVHCHCHNTRSSCCIFDVCLFLCHSGLAFCGRCPSASADAHLGFRPVPILCISHRSVCHCILLTAPAYPPVAAFHACPFARGRANGSPIGPSLAAGHSGQAVDARSNGGARSRG